MAEKNIKNFEKNPAKGGIPANEKIFKTKITAINLFIVYRFDKSVKYLIGLLFKYNDK